MKSADQIREEFSRVGQPISEWARENGFTPQEVFEVLAGRNQGRRGKAHDIAVMLGMKDGVTRQKALAGRRRASVR